MTDDPDECHANLYGDRALCGCDMCREYTAERISEDEV
jgi:hypothetical protein